MMTSTLYRSLALSAALTLSACPQTPESAPANVDAALAALGTPLSPGSTGRQVTLSAKATVISSSAQISPSVEVTPTSLSVGVTTARSEAKPPYALEPTIRFDGRFLQIAATTDLPEGTLYRLAVQREIAVRPSPTSTLTSMMSHAGGFLPGDPVTLPEEGLPSGVVPFIPEAGRIKSGAFAARVEMFPRHIQTLGAESEPERYTPNADQVQVTIAVERDLPGQVTTLTWPEGSDRFTWQRTVPCPLPAPSEPPQ